MKPGLPLRAYLAGVALAAALPLAALVIYNIYADAGDSERREAASVSRLADHTAQDLTRFITDTRRMLESVAREYQAQLLDPVHCRSVMRALDLTHAVYANMTVRDHDDRPVCAASDRPLPPTSPEPESFAQAVRENRFVIGRAYLAPQIERWVMQFRQPINGDVGRVIGVISVPVDLVRFNFARAHPTDPPQAVTRIADGAGTIIGSSKDAESWIGRSLLGTPIWDRLLAQSENAFRAIGFDDIDRIHGLASVAGTDWRVFSSVAYEQLHAATVANVQRSAVIAVVIMLAAMVAAYWLSRIILHPTQRIAAAAAKIAAGNLAARAESGGPREIAELAARFNAMLDAQYSSQARLLETLERLHFVVKNTHTGVWDWDLASHQVHYSREWKRMLGYEDHEVREHLDEWRRLTHPDDFDPVLAKLNAFLQWPAGALEVEFRMRRKSGDYRWILSRAAVQAGSDGKPARLLGLHTDITERKRAEQQLFDRERQLSSLIANLPGAVYRCRNDRDYTMEFVSEAILQITGYPPADFTSNRRQPGSLVHKADRDKLWAEIQDALAKNKPYEVTYRIIDAGEKEKWVWERGIGVFDANGELRALEGFVLDITGRKHAEEALSAHAARLQAISRKLLDVQEEERRLLARELHDEVGQVLTALKINLQMLERQQATELLAPKLAECARIADHALQEVRTLILQLRPPQLDELGLATALHTYAELQAAISNLPLHYSAPAVLPKIAPVIEISCFRIAQGAFTNVLRHAEAKQAWIELAVDGNELRLTVRDDGKGFEPTEARARAVRGVSLGLLSMEERAALAGGHIKVESAPGAGTTVRAVFPLTRPAHPGDEATAA